MTIKNTYPTVKPTISANFSRTKKIPTSINYSRLSTGTYVDEDGLIKTAGIGVPRFDHDPLTGECKGLLVEQNRINLFTYSAFPQSTTTSFPIGWDAWNPATLLKSQTLSPDGVAYGVFHGAVNQNGGGLRKNMTGLTPGGTYYVSYYVKGLTAEELTYFTNNNARGTTTGTADGAQNVPWFAATKVQFSCGNLNGTGASGNYTTVLTTEWKRFGGVITADSAGSARIIIGNNVGDTGTGNEDGGGTWMIWGAQLETDISSTSYIPTTSSAVTRAADTLTVPTGNLINTEKSSILIQTNSNFNNTPAFSLNDGTSFNEAKVLVYPTAGGARVSTNGNIVRSGLVLNLDASNPASYPGTGTTWTDLSGNGNNFTLYNSPTYDGKKFTFDGINDRASCDNTTCGNFGFESATLEYCVNVASVPSYGSLIMKRVNITSIGSTNGSGWGHRSNSSFFIQDNSTAITINSPAIDYYSGIAYHVMTFNRTGLNCTINYYINNILTGTKTQTLVGDGNVFNTASMTIFYTPGENAYTAGDVYFVRMYNRALAAPEVQQNFNALRGRYGI